jgi:hypothetical protein
MVLAGVPLLDGLVYFMTFLIHRHIQVTPTPHSHFVFTVLAHPTTGPGKLAFNAVQVLIAYLD